MAKVVAAVAAVVAVTAGAETMEVAAVVVDLDMVAVEAAEVVVMVGVAMMVTAVERTERVTVAAGLVAARKALAILAQGTQEEGATQEAVEETSVALVRTCCCCNIAMQARPCPLSVHAMSWANTTLSRCQEHSLQRSPNAMQPARLDLGFAVQVGHGLPALRRMLRCVVVQQLAWGRHARRYAPHPVAAGSPSWDHPALEGDATAAKAFLLYLLGVVGTKATVQLYPDTFTLIRYHGTGSSGRCCHTRRMETCGAE